MFASLSVEVYVSKVFELILFEVKCRLSDRYVSQTAARWRERELIQQELLRGRKVTKSSRPQLKKTRIWAVGQAGPSSDRNIPDAGNFRREKKCRVLLLGKPQAPHGFRLSSERIYLSYRISQSFFSNRRCPVFHKQLH